MRQHDTTPQVAHAAIVVAFSLGLASAQISSPLATKVISASELRRAVLNSDEHILVSEHIDGSDLGDQAVFLPLTERTKSIQGRCRDPPANIPAGYRAGQCVIVTPKQFLTTAGRDSGALLSNLYIQRSPGTDAGIDDGVPFETLVLALSGSRLWMTNVTLSGCTDADGLGGLGGVAEGGPAQPGGGCGHRGRGLHSISSRILLADCELRGFVATRGAAWLASDDKAALQGPGSVGTALALRTSFTANAADSAGPAIFALRRHVISLVNSTIPDAGGGTPSPIPIVDPPEAAAGAQAGPAASPAAPAPAFEAVDAMAPSGAAAAGRRMQGIHGARDAQHADGADSSREGDVAQTSRRGTSAEETQRPCPLATLDASTRELSVRRSGGVECSGYRGQTWAADVLQRRGLQQAGEAREVGGGGVPAVAVTVVSTAVDGEPGSEVYADPPLAVLLDGLEEARTARPVSAEGSGITQEDDAWAAELREGTPSLEEEAYVVLRMEAEAAVDGVPVDPPAGSGDTLAAGAIAGIAIAAVVAALAAAALAAWLLRRRRRQQRKGPSLEARQKASEQSTVTVNGHLLAGGGSGSRHLSSKQVSAAAVSADTSDTITHAVPSHPDRHSTAHSARSASALPGSPRSNPSSSATTMHSSVGANTGPRGGLGRGAARSEGSDSTAAFSATGATLEAAPEGARSGATGSTARTGWGGSAESAAVRSETSGASGGGWSPASGVAGGAAAGAGAGSGSAATPSCLGATRGTVMSALSFGDTTEMRTFIDATRSGASPMRELEVLSHTLDLYAERGTLFLDRFTLYSAAQRVRGGQGIVQFAREKTTGRECAVKFFTHRGAFDRERELYHSPALRDQMAAVIHLEANADAEMLMAPGWAFPPCIVVEKGESLDAWATHVKPSFIVIWQVLADILQRLAAMHACGWVHRDLKPGNALWRWHMHEWTLIDFGCAAETGSEAPLMLSLAYAAPEAVNALCRGEATIRATEALDIWAVGVMAFELLTETTVFPPFTPKDHVFRVAAAVPVGGAGGGGSCRTGAAEAARAVGHAVPGAAARGAAVGTGGATGVGRVAQPEPRPRPASQRPWQPGRTLRCGSDQ